MNKNNNKKSFKIPKGYFEGFSDRLLDRMSNASGDPKSSLLPESDGFSLPDGYFDSLNERILDKLNDDTPKVIALQSRRKLYYYAAAAVAAVVLLAIGLGTNNTVDPTFESLAKSEIENYLEYNDLGLTTYEIAEVIPVDELDISDIMDDELDEENIIDYLDNNIENIEELNLTDYEY